MLRGEDIASTCGKSKALLMPAGAHCEIVANLRPATSHNVDDALRDACLVESLHRGEAVSMASTYACWCLLNPAAHCIPVMYTLNSASDRQYHRP